MHDLDRSSARRPNDRAGLPNLSSYFVKASRAQTRCWESVTFGAMPQSIVRVSTDLTQQTRCTMRNIRWKRAPWFIWALDNPLTKVTVVARMPRSWADRSCPQA
jgi:hypothetical protein